jgi:DNA-binding GntR family transcriptional regulator
MQERGRDNSFAIERLTTAERVADALREQLLSGVYAPGTPMRDTDLSARASVSRTTMREALAQLARDGLLTHSLHRGMEVARLAPEDIGDIYALRRLVELAGARAMIAAGPANLSELERAVAAMATATARRDRRKVVEADVAFHTAIAAALGNRRLLAAVAGALSELRLVLSVTDRADGDLKAQLRQHRALLERFRIGDLQIVAALDAHLHDAEIMVRVAVEAAEWASRVSSDRLITTTSNDRTLVSDPPRDEST